MQSPQVRQRIHPTLQEGLKAFANDCYEPVNLRDNGVIQTEWRASPAPV